MEQGMELLKNIPNGHLLYEVQEDAFKRTKGNIELNLIICILDFAWMVSRKNVEGLLIDIEGYPRDIPLFDITIKGMEHILTGMETKELVEVLVKDYWDNPIKDHFAFDKYMGILGVLMIKEKYPIERVQQILLERLVLKNQTNYKEDKWIYKEY